MNKKAPQWYVITGAPSSGKTTTLEALQKEGFSVIYEMARLYIDEEMKKGRSLTEIRNNELQFQKEILKRKIILENNLHRQKIYFLERGMHDSGAYYQLTGSIGDGLLNRAMKTSSYQKVFLLEFAEFKKDYARTENPETAKKIEILLEQKYKTYNITTVKVPWMSVKKRVQFIKNNL